MTTTSTSWPFQQHGITPAESRVLVLLSRGLANQQIADRLCLHIETVRSHLKQVYRTLGVHTRSEAMVWAFRSGELPPDEVEPDQPASDGSADGLEPSEHGDEQRDQTDETEDREHGVPVPGGDQS